MVMGLISLSDILPLFPMLLGSKSCLSKSALVDLVAFGETATFFGRTWPSERATLAT